MENWKDIEGYEGLYRISDLGNVLSLNYGHRGYPSLLTPKINNQGYAWVDLRKNNTSAPLLIHRLVATAFLDNPNEYPVVNHKDENPLNNTLDNLEWCTNSYNVRYSMNLHPLRSKTRKPRKHGAYKFSNKVRQIDVDTGKVIREYDYICDAIRALQKRNDFGIRQCCLGKRKTAYGYRWEFCE